MCEKENLTEAFNVIFPRGINIIDKENSSNMFKQLNNYHKYITADKSYKIKPYIYTCDTCLFVYKNKQFFIEYLDTKHTWMIRPN